MKVFISFRLRDNFKGQCHEIFYLGFFHDSSGAPEYPLSVISHL